MALDYISSKLRGLKIDANEVLESIRRFVHGVADNSEVSLSATPFCELIATFFKEQNVEPKGVASFHDFKCGVNLKLSLDEASKYKNVLFLRHPYKRFVSGFFDKYVVRKPYFSFIPKNFMDAVENIKLLDHHHFCPQLSESWIRDLNYDAVFDIEKIDYGYLSKLLSFDVKPRFIHQNYSSSWSYEDKSTRKEKCIEKMINVPFNDLLEIKGKVDWTCFYSKNCESKLRDYYEKDFEFWENINKQ